MWGYTVSKGVEKLARDAGMSDDASKLAGLATVGLASWSPETRAA